jgi:Spy/CpxP family protein refolding chaperone
MRNNRKIIVGMVAAAALAASGSLVYAQPQGYGPGYGPGNCAQGAENCAPGAGRGAMGYGPGAQRGSGPGMMGSGPGAGRGGPGMWSNPAAAVEGHLAALKVELKITPDQDKAWQAFAAKARAQSETMIARRAQFSAQAPAANKTAPEILAQRTEQRKQGLASMETMTAAVKDLYGVLTPEQKTLADQQLARGPMGGFGGGRGGHGGHGFRR